MPAKKARKTQKKTPTKHTPTARHKMSHASRLFLPWPIFAFLMLVVGVFLVYLTFSAAAIDYTVRAKVPAPPLTDPAIIDTPTNGARFSDVPIKVAGSCPDDSYVNLYRNNFYSGSALCIDNRFEITSDLFEGANELQAKVFNFTDDEGPQSPTVTVYYDKPASPEPELPTYPGGGSTGSPARPVPAKAPFIIRSDFSLIGYYVGQMVRWKVDVSGGSQPYALSIDWGDGKSDLISLKEPGRLTLEHIYKKPGGHRGNYTVKITGSDNSGSKTYLQLFVLVNEKNVPLPVATVRQPLGPGSYFNSNLLKYIWPAYLVVALMAISFWLGEREELAVLRRQGLRRRH